MKQESGYHITIGAYGFWLPNDPRGSWSTEVWAKHLRPHGGATKVTTRHSVARRHHDHETRTAVKRQLKYPPVKFNGRQARAVGAGFADIIQKLEWTIHACAIMPDHAHLVMPCHDLKSEEIVGCLKRAATRQLNAEG